MRCRLLLLALGLGGALGSGLAQATGDAGCSACHEQGQRIQGSAHAPLACSNCHPGHEQYPHAAPAAKPACAACHTAVAGEQNRGVHSAAPDCAVCHGGAHEVISPGSLAFRKKAPDTCGTCHAEVAAQYKGSVHGRALERGVADAPLCTDCHGEHSILKHTDESSPVHVRHIRETCARCHGDLQLSRKFGLPVDRVVSFDATFHGLAARAGSQTVANCASCHGFHDIRPSSDAASTIHAKNLPATCGQCHAEAGRRFSLGPIHVVEGRMEPVAARWARWFYQVAIPVIVGLMLVHNAGDWLRKLRARNGASATLAGAARSPEVRMFVFERVEHALLALSFVVLAWTGFALKYPDQWWARPLLAWEGAARGLIHRIASVVFLATGALHVLSLALSRRLRRHWRLLWPSRGDPAAALRGLAYNLGLCSEQPRAVAYSYVEKIEYWAVVWGGAVMAVTGVALWANDLSLAWLPKSALDFATTVHLYEAVLATLSILLWHLYWVIFDPDVYPMETAWLRGASIKRHRTEQAP